MVRVVRSRFRRQHAGSADPGKRAFISYSRKDKALAEALVSDPDRVRLHTRILTQAWEWQARGRRRSALLRGQDLRRAQQWLDRHDTADDPITDDPSPTGLQRDYLGASRVASRQRVAAGTVAMVAVLVTAVVLGTTPIRAGHADESRRLAQLAGEQASDNLDAALLLGREALRTSDTVQARSCAH